jgi:hypothetical protein
MPATHLGTYQTVLVQVSSDVKDRTKEAIEIEATVAMIAREKLRFQQVLTQRHAPDAKGDLCIEARIVRLENVTAESRNRSGVLAGRARVTADVVLIDVVTGAVAGRFTAEGESSGAGTTEQAIKRASEQIVPFVAAYLDG